MKKSDKDVQGQGITLRGEVKMRHYLMPWTEFLRTILGDSGAVEDLRRFFSSAILNVKAEVRYER